MTFEEARGKHLQDLKGRFATLWGIIADPEWNNPGSKEYKEAFQEFQWTIDRICRVNTAQLDAKPKQN